MKKLRYHLVDVFTDSAFGGNQLVVFTDARGLAPETMQAIDGEMNLSETAFVLPPEDSRNDYRVRIFTPAVELPMAGHPTIGTAFVLAVEGMIGSSDAVVAINLEESVGVIPVRTERCHGGRRRPAPPRHYRRAAGLVTRLRRSRTDDARRCGGGLESGAWHSQAHDSDPGTRQARGRIPGGVQHGSWR